MPKRKGKFGTRVMPPVKPHVSNRILRKTVEDLIHETPVRVRLSKREADMEREYQRGVNAGREEADKAMRDEFMKIIKQQQDDIRKTERAMGQAIYKVIENFSRSIFLLGQNSRQQEVNDA